jgi:hypothetical protein
MRDNIKVYESVFMVIVQIIYEFILHANASNYIHGVYTHLNYEKDPTFELGEFALHDCSNHPTRKRF